MKRYSILYILSAFLLMTACNDDEGVTLNTIEQSVIESLPTGNLDLEELAEDGNPLLFTVHWTPTGFYTNNSSTPTSVAPLTYSVELDHLGLGFATARTFAATSADSVNVYVNDLNSFLLTEMGAAPGEQVQVELRIVAKYGEGTGNQSYSSNVQTLAVTPYVRTETDPLQPVYLVGDMNGWNTSNTDFMIFRANSNEERRIYTYTGRLEGYFKFMLRESVGTWNLYYTTGDGTLAHGESEGGAFFVDNKYVTVTLDLDNMTWTIEDYDMTGSREWEMINFVGDFSNWGANGEDPAMTKSAYDPHIWTLTVQVDNPGYGVKFRASHSWDNRWCPPVPSDIPYGQAEHNPSHDNNISIGASGEYFVKFNDLTGHYIVMLK